MCHTLHQQSRWAVHECLEQVAVAEQVAMQSWALRLQAALQNADCRDASVNKLGRVWGPESLPRPACSRAESGQALSDLVGPQAELLYHWSMGMEPSRHSMPTIPYQGSGARRSLSAGLAAMQGMHFGASI